MPRGERGWSAVLAVALLVGGPVRWAWPQERSAGVSIRPEDRARLFAELDEQVEAYDHFSRIANLVVRLVSPTVVHIDSVKRTTADARVRSRSAPSSMKEAGSGVIIQLDGRHFVLTNRHVVLNAPLADLEIRQHNGSRLQPLSILADPETDVAVVAVEQQRELVAARLGDSQQVRIGQSVLAVGSPFGLSHSVTAGIISAKGRRELDLGNDGVWLQDFLQTDAAVNPGNSGGPLVNLRGEVIGINTAIASNSGGSEGIGFAIPINMAVFVARQLVRTGKVAHAYLGVRLENAFGPEMAQRLGLGVHRGALVKGITPDSPADKTDLQVGDLIVRFNDTSVEDDIHLVNLVSLTPIGQIVSLEALRDGRRQVITVQVGDRNDFEP
jgi:serine protease Do